jgi:hypothetical protein
MIHLIFILKMISLITQIYIFTIIVTVIGIFVYIRTNGPLCAPKETKKEGFISTPNGAVVDGGIHGYGMITDQMIHKPVEELIADIQEHGRVTGDGSDGYGLIQGGGFEAGWACQREVQELDAQSPSGYHQPQILDKMSKKISQVGNNADMCLISRASYKPTKMILMPNANISVMEEKYYPDRKKNHQLISAGSITAVKGFDLNIDRIGMELNTYHNSSIAHHNKPSRIPTATGATLEPTGSVTEALVQEVKNQNGESKIIINADTSNGKKAVVYDTVPEESGIKISSKYATDTGLPIPIEEGTEVGDLVEKEGFMYLH